MKSGARYASPFFVVALTLACSSTGESGGGDGGSGADGQFGGGTGGLAATGGTSSGGGFASGGTPSTGGAPATGGMSSTGGTVAVGGGGGVPSGGTPPVGGSGAGGLDPFSFFVTSLVGLQRLSGSQDGFGGDLRFGQPSGLEGADAICLQLAEASMPGAGAKGWRAFLSVAAGPDGVQVDAIDRIGEGPWYDRLGRVVAMDKAALLNDRPLGADPAIVDDLPNEDGIPNHQPDPSQPPVDNHHVLTGSGPDGRLYQGDVAATCSNWDATVNAGRPRVGFSWPAGRRVHWISGQDEGGCGAGVNLAETGGSDPSNPIVGSGGGYGAIYCFALTP